MLAAWAAEVAERAHLVEPGVAELAASTNGLRDAEARVWHTPGLVARAVCCRGTTAYGRRVAALYRAVVDTHGCELVVDATKVPSGAALAAMDPGVRVSVVHVVREPRGTVHSWSARKCPTWDSARDELGTLSMTNAAVRWLGYNALGHLLCLVPGVDHRLLRYEDFVADPVGTVEDLAAWLGVRVPPSLFVDATTVRLTPCHAVAGNPDRFGAAMRTVRSDQRWRTAMPRWRRAAVAAITWPLAARYGYAPRTRGPAHRDHARAATSVGSEMASAAS